MMAGPLKHLLAAGLAGYCVLLPQAGQSQELAWAAQEEVAIGPSDSRGLHGSYRGTFMNTTYNIGGDVTLRFKSDDNSQVTGYVNFSNKPGAQPICGAGIFNGLRNGSTLSIQFTSKDPDPGCNGYDQNWAFNVSAVISADGTRLENGTYQVNNSQAGVFEAALSDTVTDALVQNTNAKVSPKKLSVKSMSQLAQIGQHQDTVVLDILCMEQMQKIPEDIGKLKGLRVLRIDCGNGGITNPQIPDSIGKLSELRELVLHGAQDPSEGHGVGSPPGTYRSLKRRTLPSSMASLKNLERLNLGRNRYPKIPSVVFSMTGLRELDMSYSELIDLPNELRNLPRLSKIILNGNYAITCKPNKQAELRKRFPAIHLDFTNEYDSCR